MKLKIFVLSHKYFECEQFDPSYMVRLYNYECNNDLNNFKDNFYYETYMIRDVFYNKEKYLDDDTEYIGFCHYRRYFNATYNELINLLQNDKIILLTPFVIYEGILNQYNNYHDLSNTDIKIIRNIIEDRCSDYLSIFDNFFNGYYGSFCNMFICSVEVFDEYCKWVYPIIKEYTVRMNFNTYEDVYDYIKNNEYRYPSYVENDINSLIYSARIGGFIIERLINVFFLKNYMGRIEFKPLQFNDK